MQQTKTHRRRFLLLLGIAVLQSAYIVWGFYRKNKLENIWNSDICVDDKFLYSSLARSPDGITLQTELRKLAYSTTVWNSRLTLPNAEVIHLYLLDKYVRKVAPTPVPLTLVVIGNDGIIITWRRVCPWSLGFLAARLASTNPITIELTTRANWFRGVCIDRYIIDKSHITEDGATATSSFDAAGLTEAEDWKFELNNKSHF